MIEERPSDGTRSGRAHLAALLALLAACGTGLGCISTPYEYSHDVDGKYTLRLRPGEEQIERGRPNAFLDGVGHYLISLPAKILLLHWNVDNHDISPETEAALRVYLAENDLDSVKVRLNQYAPGDEWRRLAHNKDVGAFWRWTFGALSTTFYTILPGRFFAGLLSGDEYNPFTNTINLYSDNLPVALHEAGHAKDFALKSNRHWRGGYAALRILPLVPLWQEGVATSDAISYLYEKDDVAMRKSAYRTLYPAYGTYVGSVGGDYFRYLPLGPGWVGYAIAYGPVVVGHLVGQTRALFVEPRDDLPRAPDWPPPAAPEPPPAASEPQTDAGSETPDEAGPRAPEPPPDAGSETPDEAGPGAPEPPPDAGSATPDGAGSQSPEAIPLEPETSGAVAPGADGER